MTRVPYPDPGHPFEQLEEVCRRAVQGIFPSLAQAHVKASFYPYIGLTHTVRRRGSGYVFRLSDHCRHATSEVLEAIAVILVCKLKRQAPARAALELYDRFRRSPELESAVRTRRRSRGRKEIGSAQGRHHSLAEIFLELNGRYFGGRVEVEKLGWGARRSWSRLGHHDPMHNTITISPVLDTSRVPRYVVAFILYHEMLHTLFGAEAPIGKRRRHHPAEFRRTERAYPDYDRATKFLGKYCKTRGRGGVL